MVAGVLEIDEQRGSIYAVRGGGCFMLFGLAFAGFAGLFVWLLLTGGEVQVNGRPGKPADAWMPGLFIVFGAVLAFGRRTLRVDLSHSQVTRRWTWLGIPVHTATERLSDVVSVALVKVVTRSSNNSGSSTSFRVRLKDGSAADGLEVASHATLMAARLDAEKAARLAGVPLIDETDGSPTVREPGELDQSVLERDTSSGTSRPRTPPDSVITPSWEAGGATFALPPMLVVIIGGGLLAAVPIAMVVGFWWFFWRDAGGQSAEGFVGQIFDHLPLLFVGLFVLQAMFAGWRRGALGTTVAVGADGLKAAGRRIPASELEELHVMRRGRWTHILARSDRTQLRFGYGLPRAELEYLRESILYALRLASDDSEQRE